jgi:hypothetical protein
MSSRKNPMLALRQNNLQSELIRLKRLEDEHLEDMQRLQKTIRESQQMIQRAGTRLRKIKAKEQQVRKILSVKRRAENQLNRISK